MFKQLVIASSMALAATLGVASAHADPSPQDKQFVAEAASGGMLEVRLGEYASQNAASDDVKKFGEHMVDDHSKANDTLKTIASQESIEVPKEMNTDDQAVLARLEALKGADFDKAYVAQMVVDHQKDIAAFEKESNDGGDGAVKGFASDTLPILRHHLEMAQDNKKKLDGGQ